MRILFCNFEYPPLGGGGGVFNQLLAEELAKKNEVTLLTSQGLDLPREEVLNGVRIIRIPCFFRRQQAKANFLSMFAYMAQGVASGKWLLQPSQFDLINTHFVLPTGPVGDALSKQLKIPNVLSVHGGDLYDPSKFSSPHRHFLLRHWVRRLLRSADAIVGQSRNTIANLQKYYDSTIHPTLNPLGIKRPPEGVGSREEYGFKKDDILLVTVGRLVARKGIDQLLAMMGKLKTDKVHLIVIGEGPLREKLEGKDERVHFMGFVSEEEKFRILRMSDIFVSASQHEGFGLMFLEAMASGLPILCYDNGGQTDFLENGRTGYVVKLKDQEALAENCQKMIRDMDRRKTMAMECSNLVEDYFIERCAERYETLFQQISKRPEIEDKRDSSSDDDPL